MSDGDQTFGAEFYEALKSMGGFELITNMMNYDAIQKLKAADREATLKMFRGSSYQVLQYMKQHEPERVAEFLIQQMKAVRSHEPMPIVLTFLP